MTHAAAPPPEGEWDLGTHGDREQGVHAELEAAERLKLRTDSIAAARKRPKLKEGGTMESGARLRQRAVPNTVHASRAPQVAVIAPCHDHGRPYDLGSSQYRSGVTMSSRRYLPTRGSWAMAARPRENCSRPLASKFAHELPRSLDGVIDAMTKRSQ